MNQEHLDQKAPAAVPHQTRPRTDLRRLGPSFKGRRMNILDKQTDEILAVKLGAHPQRMRLLPVLLLCGALLTPAVRAAEIHAAADAGDLPRLTSLLATNHDLIQLPGQDALTPLHLAARAGKLKAVALLLEHGAEVNATDDHGCTPLHSAVYGQHADMVEFLLQHRATVNAARADGTTPIFYAAKMGDTNLVSLLLKRGANPAGPHGLKSQPLHVACQGGYVGIADLLVTAAADLEARDAEGQTPLHAAAKNGHQDMVEWLLSHGADAEAKDALSLKPVDYATGTTNAALVALLDQYTRSRPEDLLPAKVGEAGDPDRIVFEGLQTFTSEQIRHALAIKPSYLLAGHPQANLRVFLNELRVMLESGYQAAGFPEGHAAVRYDRPTLQIHVRVSEGARFNAGKIRVLGAKTVSQKDLIQWFTTQADQPKTEKSVQRVAARRESQNRTTGETWNVQASAELTASQRAGGLNTPGKAIRPDEPMWTMGQPVDFSAVWATQAVAQVEACLAEQGYFFPEVSARLERYPADGTADLVVMIIREGPPGIIGNINVTGMHRDTASEIARFLDLREGGKISAPKLAVARGRLRDCGRFWDFEIMPEYEGAPATPSRRVDLRITVKEQEGVPRLGEPLSPVQQALIRLCDWIEGFPQRNEDVFFSVRGLEDLPLDFEFVLAPQRGLLVNAELNGPLPFSAGLQLATDTVQFCTWASSNKLAAPRAGGGKFFLHLLPDQSGGSNRFNLSVGGGYSSVPNTSVRGKSPWLNYDIQLSRAAFLDLVTRLDSGAQISGGVLVLTNEGFTVRADAKTGRLLELLWPNDQPPLQCQFGVRVWDQKCSDFSRRARSLENRYTPGHGFSSLLSVGGEELGRIYLAKASASTNAEQRRLALAALHKLIAPEILTAVDQVFSGNETDTFSIPMDDVDSAMAANNIVALFSGLAFDWSGRMFPKYSWPWTATREAAFLMMSQGRYTDSEFEKLYNSEDTGPVGCLALAKLLSTVGSPAASAFAMRGLSRMGKSDFLSDCNLFLRGDSGLARAFARMIAVLRTLPEDELAALLAGLPEREANLLREAAGALRSHPDAPLDKVLAPAIGNYWEGSLRARVRAALHRLMIQPSPRNAGLSVVLTRHPVC